MLYDPKTSKRCPIKCAVGQKDLLFESVARFASSWHGETYTTNNETKKHFNQQMIDPPYRTYYFLPCREDMGHMYGYWTAAEVDMDTHWPICSLTSAITLALFVFDNFDKIMTENCVPLVAVGRLRRYLGLTACEYINVYMFIQYRYSSIRNFVRNRKGPLQRCAYL